MGRPCSTKTACSQACTTWARTCTSTPNTAAPTTRRAPCALSSMTGPSSPTSPGQRVTSAATPPSDVQADPNPGASAAQPRAPEEAAEDEAATTRRPLLRRTALWWGVGAVLLVAGDAVLTSMISSWRAEAADLQTQAHGI